MSQTLPRTENCREKAGKYDSFCLKLTSLTARTNCGSEKWNLYLCDHLYGRMCLHLYVIDLSSVHETLSRLLKINRKIDLLNMRLNKTY